MTDEWRTIPDWPEYEISEVGAVRRVTSGVGRHTGGAKVGRILKPWRNPQTGYLCVSLWRNNQGRQITIHRLVALAFLGPPLPGQEVAHNDGSRTNNAVENLRWATHKENTRDALIHGTANVGVRNGMSRLHEDTVRAILLLEGVATQAMVAEKFGIARQTVGDIWRGRRWKHLH